MTHVRPATDGGQRAFLAAARTASKACSKVHLKTRLPYDELHASLVRWDETEIDPKDWKIGLERYLGPVSQFGPRHTKPCPWCDGVGHEKTSDGSPDSPRCSEVCRVCRGTGVRARPRERR